MLPPDLINSPAEVEEVMADISITDQVNLSTSVKIRDDSPLAQASLKNLHFSSLPIVGDFAKPINHFSLNEAVIGLDLAAPALSLGNNLHLGFAAGVSAALSIYVPPQKSLFGDDEFAPAIQIGSNECWAGLRLAFTLKDSVSLAASGIGVNATVGTEIAFGTFVDFPQNGSNIPAFKEGLATVLESYSIPGTPEKVRAIPVGIAHTSEAAGKISLGVCYSAPLQLNPFATLGLPFNLALKVEPAATAAIKAAISLDGSFTVRSYRSSSTNLILGVYKKKKTAFTAALSASAGIEADVASVDILSTVLNAVVPSPDLGALHLDSAQNCQLSQALGDCVDQSISIAINACCSASVTDEAAVVYELDLTRGDTAQTDAAIAAALRGDWSHLGSLSNAREIRNIVRELHDHNHKLNLNLLGLYNAASISDYLTSSTVLHDEHGQITMVDKASATHLSTGTTPYAAESNKLRAALAQAFIATTAYGVSAGKAGLTSFTVRQTFLEYHAQADSSDLKGEILLARAAGLSLNSQWDDIANSNSSFSQNKFYLDACYDTHSVMCLFYQNVDQRIPHAKVQLDRLGRDTKIALLDPSATNSMQRRMALASDEIWTAMDSSGNMTTFKSISRIAKMPPSAINAIAADWKDIRSWSDALQSLTPKLTAVLASSGTLEDKSFITAHKNLAVALSKLTSDTRSAFGDGWDIAVMCRLAALQAAPSLQMDIGWNQKFEHYQSGVQIAVGQTIGA